MRNIVVFTLLIVISVSSGCFLPVEEDLLPPDLLRPEEIRFITMEVERGTIQHIIEDGGVIAQASINYALSFENRSGYLLEINAVLGGEVKKGDVLARLDTGSLETNIIRQQIEVEKRSLTLEEISRTGGSRFARRHAELDLELAMMTLAELEDDLLKATIIAPIDGEIVHIQRDLKIGGFIPERSIILTIADTTLFHFEYNGSYVNNIRHGMEAKLIIDSKSYPATVTMTPMNAPPEERDRYRNLIIFSLINPDDLPANIKSGSRHRFSIFVEEKQNTVIIPAGIMSTFIGQSYVQILEDGMRVERDVIPGIVTATHVEILNGLNEGDLLIVGIKR